MKATMLPPAHERDTEPPEKSRDSTLPPTDLGPTGIALRLLALEERVADIHAETLGISKAFHDIKNGILSLSDSFERLANSVSVLRHDQQGQRLDRARLLEDMDEVKKQVTAIQGRLKQ